MDEFEKAGRRIIVGAGNGMENFAAAVMYDSLIECPIDTGTLRGSAQIDHTTSDGKTLHTEFGYGYGTAINPKTRRPAAEYAVPVHEILEARHDPPTKAKFLEDPLFLHAKDLGPVMAAEIRKALRFKSIIMEVRAENILGTFRIMSRTSHDQPIVKTPRGPRFAKKRHK